MTRWLASLPFDGIVSRLVELRVNALCVEGSLAWRVRAEALADNAATGTGIFDSREYLVGNDGTNDGADDEVGDASESSGELFKHSTISSISMRFSPSCISVF